MPLHKKCITCGKDFKVPPSRESAKYCSQDCMPKDGSNNPHWQGGKVTLKCAVCGNDFSVKKSKLSKNPKYCSNECRHKGESKPKENYIYKRVIKNCIICGKENVVKLSHADVDGTYCSKQCMAIDYANRFSGEGNPNWKGNSIERSCEFCGNTYRKYIKEQKFCSIKCRSDAKKKAPYTALYPAKICGHLAMHGRKYCKSCSNRGKTVDIKCKACEKVMNVPLHQKDKIATCSKECSNKYRSEYQKGEKSHKWLGGKTDQNIILRNSAAYRTWRKSVFERDDYTCQLCGERGGNICADHINPWALYPALRFDLENGRTLCRDCHSEQDTTGAKLSNLIQKEKMEKGALQYRLI